MLRNIVAIFGVFSLACTPAVAAQAQGWQDQDRPPQWRVSYADLDLSTPQGQARLDQRIRVAAHRICDSANNVRDLHAIALETRCRRDAHGSTERQVAQAMQTARQRHLAVAYTPIGAETAGASIDRRVVGAQ